MSIIRAAVKLIIREHAKERFGGRVLSLGVPEVHATAAEIAKWLSDAGIAPRSRAEESAEITPNPTGKKLKFVSGRAMLSLLGFEKVDTLDVPGCEQMPEIIHDLNDPISPEQQAKYDFVLDPGTLEHVFDQATCLKNIAKFLKVGGAVCHLVPIYSYNGGYYSINPNVLHDFYRANGFDVTGAYILMWDRYKSYAKTKTYCYAYDDVVMGSRHAIGDLDQVRYTPHLLLFARKVADVRDFQSPMQFGGNYAEEASALAGTRAMALETRGKAVAKLAFKILPFHVAFYIQTAAYRWATYFRSRRRAGFKI